MQVHPTKEDCNMKELKNTYISPVAFLYTFHSADLITLSGIEGQGAEEIGLGEVDLC